MPPSEVHEAAKQRLNLAEKWAGSAKAQVVSAKSGEAASRKELDDARKNLKRIEEKLKVIDVDSKDTEDVFEIDTDDGADGGEIKRRPMGMRFSQRVENEEKIEALRAEHSDLLMKLSANTAEIQKLTQRAWDLEKQLSKVNSELTKAKVALERKEMNDDWGLEGAPPECHQS